MKVNKITFGLGRKILILFSFFAFTLLLIVLVHQYLSSQEYIVQESNLRIDRSNLLYAEAFNEAIQNYYSELSALQFRMQYDQENLKYYNQQVESFLLSYKSRYNKISLLNLINKKSIIAVPEKLFTGAYNVVIEDSDKMFNQYIPKEDSIIFSGNNVFLYKYFPQSLVNLLIAEMSLNNVLKNFIENIVLPESIELTVLNRNKTVAYNSDERNLNVHYSNVFKSSGIDLDAISQSPISINNYRFKSKFDPDHQLYLIIKDDLRKDYSQLYSLLIRLLLFSALLFIIIVIVLRMLAKRISLKLTSISNVTKQVGQGNLNTQIDITSNDEIGLLVSSFNEMIIKLKGNYELLNDTNLELHDKIDELTSTKHQLSEAQRLAVIGETVAKVSHEIQNKISGISLWIQNLEHSLKGDSTSIIYIKEIKSSLNEFLEMLNNFKRFYRKPKTYLTEINMSYVISRILTSYKDLISNQALNIETYFNHDGKGLLADEELIDEVLRNLILNAIQASNKGDKIIIETDVDTLNFNILVHDSGDGIDKKLGADIFSPFITTKSKGSGLGLAISKNIVTAHNGELGICDSKLGGACFKISLPISKQNMVTKNENIIN